jgi:hypothetical protein
MHCFCSIPAAVVGGEHLKRNEEEGKEIAIYCTKKEMGKTSLREGNGRRPWISKEEVFFNSKNGAK